MMHQPHKISGTRLRLTRPQAELSRRTLIAGLASAGGLALAGCGRTEPERAQNSQTPAPPPAPSPTPQLAAMTVYRDPSCGCCGAWAQIARNAGYQVQLSDHPDMPAIKRQHGVPDELWSCHTGIVGGYAVEGHVPLDDVKRLLSQRPAGIRGIAVPGMPLGSPGMEVPDGTTEAFQVMAFDASGRITPFAAIRTTRT